MPQIDSLTYFSQVFWVVALFSFWFSVASVCILPAILQTLNARTNVLQQTDEIGASATSGVTDVYDNISDAVAGAGENECDSRLAGISNSSNESLVNGSVLSALIIKADNRSSFL